MVWLKDQYQHRPDGAEQWEQLLEQMRTPPVGVRSAPQASGLDDGVAAYLAAAGAST